MKIYKKGFEDKNLPNLDNMEGWRIMHIEHNMKPMTTNIVLQAKTALSVTVKAAYLKRRSCANVEAWIMNLSHSKRLETPEKLTHKSKVKISTVIFVPSTKGVIPLKKLKEREETCFPLTSR
jgi:hypothetical protein